MEGHFPAGREDLYHVQMEVKHVQAVQTNLADRILRLEKRQADDAALKSVWNSPFPSVLGGTPQHGPISIPSAEVFEDFDDEHGQNLLGSLHLEAEDEPVRRGASRANSVRFDVSAIQGSNWAQSSRNSGDFGPVRPNSGFGGHPMTERSFSHKSDGRHSSAGHSVHSMHSGRTSSLGLDTNFIIGDPDDDSPIDAPEPPPGFFILGTVPAIIRCWLNENWTNRDLVYASVCTGSQKSLIDYSLVKELELLNLVQVDHLTGRQNIRLPVYLPEAVVTQPNSRTNSPAPHLPALTANFEITGTNQRPGSQTKKPIRVFLGSDTLRLHGADILFSQNIMTLYGDDRRKLSVPFVRPEDDNMFKNICTGIFIPEAISLKATAQPFTPVQRKPEEKSSTESLGAALEDGSIVNGVLGTHQLPSDRAMEASMKANNQKHRSDEDVRDEECGNTAENTHSGGEDSIEGHEDRESPGNLHDQTTADADYRGSSGGSSGGIWGSWRSGGITGADIDTNRENASGYNRAGRGGRSMKVLKPSKVTQSGRSSSNARTGAAYEPPAPRMPGESRRKSQAGLETNSIPLRWESKRTVSDEKPAVPRNVATVPRSSNPIGGASAFAWMNPGKSMANATTAE